MQLPVLVRWAVTADDGHLSSLEDYLVLQRGISLSPSDLPISIAEMVD